jgi:HK97 family phage major capsid protein
MRNLSTSSSGAGIPTDMERRIVDRMFQANVLRQIAPVSTIDSKRTIPVQNALPTTALVGESVTGTPAPISASDPTFSTAISVVPYKYVTRVEMSQEFIEDAIGQGGIGSGLQYVADKCGLSVALKQEEAYTIGTGSSQPQGVAATAQVLQGVDASAAITTIDADEVIDCYHACPVQYRNSPRFRWLLSDTALKVIRKLKTNNNDYIFSPTNAGSGQMTVGLPGTIYGAPYSVSQYMLTTGTTANTKWVICGDFNYFEIFDRTGITSMVDPYSGASNHLVNLYVYTRTDSHIMLPEAFSAIFY